jgi:hypothetical protein
MFERLAATLGLLTAIGVGLYTGSSAWGLLTFVGLLIAYAVGYTAGQAEGSAAEKARAAHQRPDEVSDEEKARAAQRLDEVFAAWDEEQARAHADTASESTKSSAE